MPLQASSAPDGLTVRITRVRYGDRCLRIWRAGLDSTLEVPTESRRDFVLVHGIGVSSQYFEKLALELAQVGMVYLLDLPGFARVPRPHGELDIADFAALVGRWARDEGLVRPVLIGHSMGAQIVTELLASDPDLAEHAVLIGPPVNLEERSTVTQALRLVQSSVRESSRTRRVAMSGYLTCGPRWFLQVLPQMITYPIEDRLPQVQAHLLVVRGVHDAVAPEAWIEMIAALPADARWTEIEGAAHAVIYDHSHEVAELVLDHLRR
ncbi:MAG: alpha/beta fold hydrolase [Cellulomonadaceae bacterium]